MRGRLKMGRLKGLARSSQLMGMLPMTENGKIVNSMAEESYTISFVLRIRNLL